MNLSTPQKVRDLITAGDELRQVRSENRGRINSLANGFPPMEQGDAEKAKIQVNVNWGEMADLLLFARRQYTSAQFNRPSFYDVKMPLAPLRFRDAWSAEATNWITGALKDSKTYFERKKSQIASVVAHGIGPVLWTDNYGVLADTVALEDLAVATDTKCDHSNLDWFGVRIMYTEGELGMKVFGPNSSRFWNKAAVANILRAYSDENTETTPPYNWWDSPEKMYELRKQNLYLYTSDAVPKMPMWHVYHKDEERGRACWKLKVIPDTQCKGIEGAREDEFLYDSGSTPFADKLDHILAVTYGDLCNKSPFLYHSVRSLGYMLMEPVYWSNLGRCRFFQHVMENLNPWWKMTDPAGAKGRAQSINMFANGVIPDGVTVVPQNERHQINADLIDKMQAQSRQLMQEKSSSYTQNSDNGTKKERTAFETMVDLQHVNSATSSLMSDWFKYETFEAKEICRRICLRRSPDPMAQEFQKAMKKAKIPTEYLNADDWDISVTLPMGAGNPTMAMAESKELMGIRPMLPPQSQMKVLHSHVLAVTGDPQRADDLVPLTQVADVSDGKRDAEGAFGTMMQGIPVQFKEADAPQDIIETLLSMLAQKIKLIGLASNMATPQELAGMAVVVKTIQSYIARLAQDPTQRQLVRKYSQGLAQLMNQMKGFVQRLQEQQKASAQQNGDGAKEAQAAQLKLLTNAAMAKQKLKLNSDKAKQQRTQKNISFIAEQHRQNLQTTADLQRQNAMAASQNRMKAFDE